MNRLFLRHCSMSSIEEEDEAIASDEPMTQVDKLLLSPLRQQQQQFYRSSSVLEWDSELSETESEFDVDYSQNTNDSSAIQAADQALQGFIQARSRRVSLNKFLWGFTSYLRVIYVCLK